MVPAGWNGVWLCIIACGHGRTLPNTLCHIISTKIESQVIHEQIKRAD
jgi:hypothetical protein